jgi:hypothetical protein
MHQRKRPNLLKTTTLKAETTTTAEVECKAEATEMVDNKQRRKINFPILGFE